MLRYDKIYSSNRTVLRSPALEKWKVMIERTAIRLFMQKDEKWAKFLTILPAIGMAFWAFSLFIGSFDWEFVDWTGVYHKLATQPLKSPYEWNYGGLKLANPPWLLWILWPFSLLPARPALALWMTFSILISVWSIKKLGGNIYIALLTLCSPFFIRLFVHGQIDVVILLGFALLVTAETTIQRGLGIVFMMIKPQVLGVAAVTHWLSLERKNKVLILLPLTTVALVSFLIYGLWPLRMAENMRYLSGIFTGLSIWPYGLPVGIMLLIISLKKDDVKLGALSTFFFVPYVGSHSLYPYIAVLFTMVPHKWATALFLLLWGVALALT